MEKTFEKWEGKEYAIREVLLSQELGGYHTRVADDKLWEAIREAYEDVQHPKHKEAERIDNSIYYYCDSELIASNLTEEEIVNVCYLEENGITCSEEELECYTDAGEDMIISLDKIMKEDLQEYINAFDINEEVMLWWQNGVEAAREKGVPFDNIKDHYKDYEDFLEWLQGICDKMPY